LAAVLTWGTSDFLGGYATRRANAFVFTAIVNLGGLIVVGTLASTSHAAFPSGRSLAWMLAGGISGGAALAIFYRALSSGRMGLTAPVAAVLSAAIPILFSMFMEGLPGKISIVGFFCAGVGLWLPDARRRWQHSTRHWAGRDRWNRFRRILSLRSPGG
jgi:uncharacterized membrane protein